MSAEAPAIKVSISQNFSQPESVSAAKDSAGRHFIADFWGCDHLDDCALMESSMRDASLLAKATMLHIHIHKFNEGGGVTGVALLAESHISVHTWPERGYAAFDVFMCGDSEPEKAIAHLKTIFSPKRVELKQIERGSWL